MAKKEFTDVTIKICQKECNFNRVTNETLTAFAERAEEEYNNTVKAFIDEVEQLEDEMTTIEKKIRLKEKQVEIIENKTDASDEEYDKVFGILEDIEKLQGDLEPIKARLIELGKTSPNKEYSKKVNQMLAEKVETFLDGITAKEFLKNSDPVDTIKAQNLEKYYQLAIVGERESKIIQMIKDDVDNFLSSN